MSFTTGSNGLLSFDKVQNVSSLPSEGNIMMFSYPSQASRYNACDISQAISIAMARAIAYISLRWWLEP